VRRPALALRHGVATLPFGFGVKVLRMADDFDLMDVTSIGDHYKTRVVARAGQTPAAKVASLDSPRRRPGSFYCEGGSGHDDPDNSGLCIKCGGVSDGGPLD
jgi:hypothetical protein